MCRSGCDSSTRRLNRSSVQCRVTAAPNPTCEKRMNVRVLFLPFSIHGADRMYKKSRFLYMLRIECIENRLSYTNPE